MCACRTEGEGGAGVWGMGVWGVGVMGVWGCVEVMGWTGGMGGGGRVQAMCVLGAVEP